MICQINLVALFTCMMSLVLAGPNNNINHKYEIACRKLGINPYFDPRVLLGPKWIIYYTWNLRQTNNLLNNCLTVNFHSINPEIVYRYYKDMGQYLQKQPLWNAALLSVSLGTNKDHMLLLTDYGPAGRLHGVLNFTNVPNVMRYKNKIRVPLMQYQMKLLQGGQYLVVMDCLTGVVTLSTHYLEEPPFRNEIESVARKLSLGPGVLTCTKTRDIYKVMKNNAEAGLLYDDNNPYNYDSE